MACYFLSACDSRRDIKIECASFFDHGFYFDPDSMIIGDGICNGQTSREVFFVFYRINYNSAVVYPLIFYPAMITISDANANFSQSIVLPRLRVN